MAVVGTKVVIPGPQDVEVFDLATGTHLFSIPLPSLNHAFNTAVAALGDDILIGAPGDDTAGDSAGAVYLFDGTTGALLRTFLNPVPDPGEPDNLLDEFGSTIAAVGGNVLVGDAYNDGAMLRNLGTVYLFDGATGALLLTIQDPSPTPQFDDFFGRAVTALGSNLVVTAAHAAYLLDGTTGAVLQTFTPAAYCPAAAQRPGTRSSSAAASGACSTRRAARWCARSWTPRRNRSVSASATRSRCSVPTRSSVPSSTAPRPPARARCTDSPAAHRDAGRAKRRPARGAAPSDPTRRAARRESPDGPR